MLISPSFLFILVAVKKKDVIVSVINDLSTDQRVNKVCNTLTDMGFQVCLVGRRQRRSLPLANRAYATRRMFLLFEKGPLFYFFFQCRLFLFLLFHKADVLVSNDLDTLWPNYLISRLKRIPLVYDTHEVFCEVPELQHNPFKKRIWKLLERRIFPKLEYVFTVNASIANLYSREYGMPLKVVRNIPVLQEVQEENKLSKKELGLPEDKFILLLQGAGINVDRGAEEMLAAMEYLNNAVLLIVGSGDVIPQLQQEVKRRKWENKVVFTGKIPFEQLRKYTAVADLGLTLDKATNVNYQLSLPNKLFDYIHAGVPVLCSDLVEVAGIVREYRVGEVIDSIEPRRIADTVKRILDAPEQLAEWKKNTIFARSKLNWQQEELVLKSVYAAFLD